MIVMDVAFVVAQVNVVVCPEFTTAGLAVNCVICGGAGATTCTVAVCCGLLTPPPVATAVYVVVCVGESVTVPEACELVVTVRVEEPAVAVMVIEVAFVVVHDNVVACPVVMDVGFAVNCVTEGKAG